MGCFPFGQRPLRSRGGRIMNHVDRPNRRDDFLRLAAQESARLLAESRMSNTISSDATLCLPLHPDATGALYRIALAPWLFMLPGLLLILFAVGGRGPGDVPDRRRVVRRRRPGSL